MGILSIIVGKLKQSCFIPVYSFSDSHSRNKLGQIAYFFLKVLLFQMKATAAYAQCIGVDGCVCDSCHALYDHSGKTNANLIPTKSPQIKKYIYIFKENSKSNADIL